jgi:pimeloyl-ACP methyl ester carboxylesterase
MYTEEFQIGTGGEKLAATRIVAGHGHAPQVLSFHGTGAAANRKRIRYLLDYLACHGVSSICFDFSGHGESSGKMEQATLTIRKNEARAAARFLDARVPPVLIGTSMGGYIASLLSPEIQPRSLILFCPAAYSSEVMELKFNGSFSAAVRRPGAYLNSPVFKALESYSGKLLIVAAGQDAIIPREVVRLYQKSAPRAQTRVLWLGNSDHKIHSWLADREGERNSVLQEALAAAA